MIAGNGYHTDLLEKMAVVMNVKSRLDSLGEGVHYRFLTYNNRKITVIVKENEVTHIGYSVFHPNLRSNMNDVVFNFLERYALEISLPMKREKSVARQLDEDGIFFRNGDFSFFKALEKDTTYAVSVENLSNKRYSVSWVKDGKTAFSVNFPIEYDLLAGTEVLENERRLLEDIPKASPYAATCEAPDSSLMKMTWQGKYWVLPGDSYYTKQLNSNRYFEKVGKKQYKLVYNANDAAESLANLMTTGAIENKYDLHVRLIKYGFVQDTIKVKLNQWINYYLRQGCTGYFGIISTEKGIADCELIMHNTSMGYIHLMRMSVDISTLEERKGIIKARLNSYINTTRVKYLFDELKK